MCGEWNLSFYILNVRSLFSPPQFLFYKNGVASNILPHFQKAKMGEGSEGAILSHKPYSHPP